MLGALGLGLQAGGMLLGASGRKKQGDAQAQSYLNRASELDDQIRLEQQQAGIDSSIRIEQYNMAKQANLANKATSGFGMKSGSFVTAYLNQLDQLNKQQKRAKDVSTLKVGSMRRQAKRYRKAAGSARSGGTIGALGGLLGGLGGILGGFKK